MCNKSTVLALAMSFLLLAAHAFAYTVLKYPGATNTFVGGIDGNNIVGSYQVTPTGGQHGYLFDGVSFKPIDVPGSATTVAVGIEGKNVVGFYGDGAGGIHGFKFNGADYVTIEPPDTKPVSNGSEAHGISGNTIVDSYFDNNSRTNGFVFDGTTYTPLNYPNSGLAVALGIDGHNIVGGYSFGGTEHGYLYDGSSFTKFDYPVAGTMATVAFGISNDLIVGYYIDAALGTNGFLFGRLNYRAVDVPAALGTDTIVSAVKGDTIGGRFSSPQGIRGFVAVIPEPSTVLLAILALPLTLRLFGKRP